MNRVLPALLVALIAAGACSSDDSASTEAEPTEPAGDESASDPAEPPEEPTASSTAGPTPEALPASFRGVTEDTIKVGVADPDWDALQAAGIPNYQGETETAFQPFFDIINAEGGIFGRQIEPVYVSYDFTSPVTQEEACTKLTEDEEVFIVLYGLLAQSNLCLTDLHDTMVMTRFFQTPELREASGDTLWLQLGAADDGGAALEVLAQSGRLDDRTIGIVTSLATSDATLGDDLVETLADLGFEAQHVAIPDVGADAVARENEIAVVAQRFMADGVDFVFDLMGGGNAPEVMAGQGYTPDFFVAALQATIDATTDKAVMDGAITVGPLSDQAIWEDDEFWDNCMSIVLDAHPELESEFEYLPTGEQQAAGEPDWLNPTIHACNYTMLLKELGEIAGADLTNDSFRAALDELGPIRLHGLGQASFNSETKWDGVDEFYIQVYDAESDSIAVEGEAIIVDRS